MPNHGQFEELCALAAVGAIAAADAELLETHLENCGSCREVLSEMQEVHAHLLPIHDDSGDATAGSQDVALRQMILKQARKEGATFSSDAWTSGYSRPRSNAFFVPVGILAVMVVVLSVALGVVWEHSRARRDKPAEPMAQSSKAEESLSAALTETKSNLLEVNNARRDLEAEVQKERLAKAGLARKLDQAQAALTGSAEQAQEKEQLVVDLKGQLEAARAKENAAEAALENLKRADETDAVATRYEIQELKEQLRASSASLDRERQMLSGGREIRDLIAARNLHIVDVYDTNAQGKTSRAFGRVFYTEGKSLVFYAYDLNTNKTNLAKFGFYVWGKRDGAPQDIKSLGRMNTDDREQKRWALTITDPKILVEIDSVFVTLEPADAGTKPSSKPLLSAFLGTPANHP